MTAASAEMEMDLSPAPVEAAVSARHSDDVVELDSDSDADVDDDGTVASEFSVASSDSEQRREVDEVNLNTDDDRGSSVDIYESRTPSPPPADTTLLPVEQTAAAAGDVDSSAVPADAAHDNEPVSVPAAEAQPVVQVLDLDNSLSCFKTTKRKKPVILPPVSRDDAVDDAEVSVFRLEQLLFIEHCK